MTVGVVDGHYVDEGAAAIAWRRAADTIVWLDLPRRTAIRRVLFRAASRVARRTELWGTNRQGLATLSPRSIASLIRRWPTYTARIAAVLAAEDVPGRIVVHLRTPAEVAAWCHE